jgi:acyl dehydratase
MAMDPSFVGYTYPPTQPYLVGREKIREFARSIGADDPIHHDPDAAKALGYPDVVAPLTFPIALTNTTLIHLIEDPNLGLEFDRVVHGDQKYEYRRPVQAGDSLVCVCTIADITERAGAGFLTSRTEVSTVEGELICVSTSRIVVRAAEPVTAGSTPTEGEQ